MKLQLILTLLLTITLVSAQNEISTANPPPDPARLAIAAEPDTSAMNKEDLVAEVAKETPTVDSVVGSAEESPGIERDDIGASSPESDGSEREDIGAPAAASESSAPSTVGGESEDIGAPLAELPGTEIEDIGAPRAGDGNPDRPLVAGNIPNAAKKPKEIVVVGSKVKETKDDDHDKWIDILSTTVQTEEDLANYMEAIVGLDENIKEARVSEDEIILKYKYPAKLFGFINIDYTATTTVDKEGRVKVRFPWFLIFAKDNSIQIEKNFEDELSSIGDDAQLGNIDLQNILQKQQQTLQTISNVAKMNHDTAMAVIRKKE